jgi:hypothetical protein
VIDDELFDEGELYWERTKGATILPSTDGPNGGGEGFFEPSVVCNAGALIQNVLMPPLDAGGSLVAEITYRTEDVERFAVGFNRAWVHLPATQGEWMTERFCLGAAAYGPLPSGGLVAVQLGPSEKASPCFGNPARGTIQVDRFTIEPARSSSECIAPGTARNGTAEIGEGGWRFVPENSPGDAELVEGVGRDQTSGVRLSSPVDSSEARAATTQLSVAKTAEVPSPALRFWWWGSQAGAFQVEVGAFSEQEEPWRSVDRLVGDDAEHKSIYCLPPWTHGSVVDLSFSIADAGTNEASELVIDDVEIVDDPRCGESTDILDPGFESGPSSWLGSYAFGPLAQSVLLHQDMEGSRTPRARTGRGALELRYETRAAELRMETFVFVPETEPSQCPKLVFHADVPADPQTSVEWLVGRAEEGTRDSLDTGGGWKRHEAPLPAEWSGRWVRFRVLVGALSELDEPIAAKRIFLDDFQVEIADCTETVQ